MTNKEKKESRNEVHDLLRSQPIKDHKSIIEIRNVLNFYSTGIPTLDYAIGGGLPLGYLIELLGEDKAGKTALTCYLISIIQKMKIKGQEGYAIDVQNEGDLKKARAVQLGVNWDKLIIDEFKLLEDTFMYVEKKLDDIAGLRNEGYNNPILIIIDSLIGSNKRIEGKDYGVGDLGRSANLVNELQKRCDIRLHEAQIPLLIINQLRTDQNPFAKKHRRKHGTAGGNPIKFMGGCKLIMEKVSEWKDSNGFTSEIEITNNKVGKPGGKTRLEFNYKTGVFPYSGIYYALDGAKKIVHGGSHKYYHEKSISPFNCDKLWEDKDIRDWMKEDLKEIYM